MLGCLLTVWLHLTCLCWHQTDVLFVPDKDPKSPLGSSSNSFILPDCGIRAPGVPGDASIAELQALRLLSAEMMEKLQEQLSFLPVCVLFLAYQQDVFHQTPINLLQWSPALSVCLPLPVPEPACSLLPVASPPPCLPPCPGAAHPAALGVQGSIPCPAHQVRHWDAARDLCARSGPWPVPTWHCCSPGQGESSPSL